MEQFTVMLGPLILGGTQEDCTTGFRMHSRLEYGDLPSWYRNTTGIAVAI